MKPRYNIQEAINLRGKTIEDLGFFDIQYMRPETAKVVVGFRQSLEITSADHHGWDIPLHAEVLGMNNLMARKTSRKEWYRAYRAWRVYISQERASECITL